MMSEEAKAAKRAYQKEWRRKNADKIRRSQNAYWERKFARMNGNEAADSTESEKAAV